MKINKRTYRLSIEEYPGGYLASFPALPGCNTWGKTCEDAVKHAEEALALYLETLAAHGDPIPEDLENNYFPHRDLGNRCPADLMAQESSDNPL